MNKTDVIDKVSYNTKESRLLVEAIFNSILEKITSKLSVGERVTLTGFGTFIVVERKARPARNPRTGENVWVDKKKVVKFIPSGALKNEVDGSR